METYMFYNYLKWKKESKNDTFNKFLKFPLLSKIAIILMITSGLLSFIMLFFSEIISFIFIIIELALGVINFIHSEKMHIDNSPQKFQNFKNYCKELRIWLESFEFLQEEQISIMQKRINNIVAEAKAKSKSRKESAEKWLQILIIPIILAVANSIINSQTDLNDIISNIVSLLIIFLCIYSIAISFVSVFSFIDNWQISKYEKFSNDLQSVLDIEFYCNSKNHQK